MVRRTQLADHTARDGSRRLIITRFSEPANRYKPRPSADGPGNGFGWALFRVKPRISPTARCAQKSGNVFGWARAGVVGGSCPATALGRRAGTARSRVADPGLAGPSIRPAGCGGRRKTVSGPVGNRNRPEPRGRGLRSPPACLPGEGTRTWRRSALWWCPRNERDRLKVPSGPMADQGGDARPVWSPPGLVSGSRPRLCRSRGRGPSASRGVGAVDLPGRRPGAEVFSPEPGRGRSVPAGRWQYSIPAAGPAWGPGFSVGGGAGGRDAQLGLSAVGCRPPVRTKRNPGAGKNGAFLRPAPGRSPSRRA